VRAAVDIQVGKLSQLPPSQCFPEHLTLNTEHFPPTPRNITFYALKPHPAITQRIAINLSVYQHVSGNQWVAPALFTLSIRYMF
jgi:hypothetical protein